MCPSGPLVLLDAGPGPGRWLKPRRLPAPATDFVFIGSRWLRAARLPGPGPAPQRRSPDGAVGPPGGAVGPPLMRSPGDPCRHRGASLDSHRHAITARTSFENRVMLILDSPEHIPAVSPEIRLRR